MQLSTFSATSLFALLVVSSSALSFADVIDKLQENIVAPIAERLQLSTAKQYPCCKTTCPPCPAFRINETDGGVISVQYDPKLPVNFRGHPGGCGKEFSEEACLYFLQVTFAELDKPLGIAIKKSKKDKKPDCDEEEKKETLGCGADSTPEECLKYLRHFFNELKKPIEYTIEYAGKPDQQITEKITEEKPNDALPGRSEL